jgi:hypothetical protein
LQYRDPKNRTLVREGLRLAGRQDLIGNGKKHLVSPAGDHHRKIHGGAGTSSSGT